MFIIKRIGSSSSSMTFTKKVTEVLPSITWWSYDSAKYIIGGVFGSLQSTPIINRPQSAVLGMHGIKQRPIAVDGEVVIRPMMYLALSYDHQVIDGSTSVTFLVKVIELLEDPMRLMMNI